MDALTQYITLYRDHRQALEERSPAIFNRRREAAYTHLQGKSLPEKGEERYTVTSLNEMFAPDYGVNINRVEFPFDAGATFHCGVPNISTQLGLVINDTFRATSSLLQNLPEGVKMMSLAQAAVQLPEIVDKYLGKIVPDDNVAAQLNTLLLQDGVLIYVPKGVTVSRPLQLVNVFNAVAPVMATRRLLVVVEPMAKASLLICDHSQTSDISYLSNQVVEIYLGEESSLDYYDLEESSVNTHRLSQLFASQSKGSHLTINGTTLIGGVTRNEYDINVSGDNAETRLAGMAIGDGSQVIDNVTCIKHLSQASTSTQLMKYVLDEQSTGSFYGTIVVDEKAKFTNAYQSNRNILASKDARMYTRPQLEIYCDEVKCSHGATTGQLDANALFYMRQRGIPLAEARLMLMQAFMADVIDTVSIPMLQLRLKQLVESRLSGNKTLCGEKSPCADIEF